MHQIIYEQIYILNGSSLTCDVNIDNTVQIRVHLGGSSETWSIVELLNCELINEFNIYTPANIKITGENPQITINYISSGGGSIS